tara:strand:- start:2962 stop:3606 length:645 start_codon:yes stop_codon:yes gene_type:complete
MKVLLIDVCHTLYESNTTFDFLEFHLRGRKKYLFDRVRRNFVFRLINKIMLMTFKKDYMRYFCMSLLKGEPLVDLECSVKEFNKRITLIEPVVQFVNSIAHEYDKVCLISGSIDFVVENLEFPFFINSRYASKSSYSLKASLYCDGKVYSDLLFKKRDKIIGMHSGHDITFISDNYTDSECISIVNKFVAVYRKNDLPSRRFWLEKGVNSCVEY